MSIKDEAVKPLVDRLAAIERAVKYARDMESHERLLASRHGTRGWERVAGISQALRIIEDALRDPHPETRFLKTYKEDNDAFGGSPITPAAPSS